MKKGAIALILVALVYTAGAVSIGQVMGRLLVKETGQPVAFAEITLENNLDKVVVTANESGYYYANRIPTGKYQMRVVYNNRTFRLNKVRVYDNYATEADFIVSNNDSLPAVVDATFQEPVISSISPTDIKLSGSSSHQPTQNLSDVLMMQPGMSAGPGGIRLKGGAVKIFIDGSPVMGPARLTGGGW